jgi:hypothetical protein
MRMSRAERWAEARRAAVVGTIAPRSALEDRELRARHYRMRAEELRAIAEEIMLRETGRTLLSLAESYDQMADITEQGFLEQTA